jgi:hypothetical protein
VLGHQVDLDGPRARPVGPHRVTSHEDGLTASGEPGECVVIA